MLLKINNHSFKKIIVLFWTLWWISAFLTDLVGALVHFNGFHAAWAQDSNYPFLLSTLSIYSVPAWLPTLFYLGIILWTLVISVLFVWASLGLTQSMSIWLPRVEKAFIISLCLWLAFFLADQIVFKFDLEENHMVQGGFQLLSYLFLINTPNTWKCE